MTQAQYIGQQIAALRLSAGLTQKELGGLCGWDGGRQSRIESGKFNLTLKTLELVSNALGKRLRVGFDGV